MFPLLAFVEIKEASRPVLVKPGSTLFTVMPNGPSSVANVLAQLATALGVDDCSSWDAEPYRVLVLVKDGKVEARTSYEPEDGGPRVRLLGDTEGVPWPKGLSTKPETPLSDHGLAQAARLGARLAESPIVRAARLAATTATIARPATMTTNRFATISTWRPRGKSEPRLRRPRAM